MSDIFAPLREPEPVSSLAPEEVRRAGDRLRRRRAGLAVVGAVCATAIVVGGTALMVGDRTSSDSPPEPVDSPTPQAVIPAEFDLADGLPREPVSSGRMLRRWRSVVTRSRSPTVRPPARGPDMPKEVISPPVS